MIDKAQSTKLSLGTKIGYSIGQLTDSLGFNIYNFFFLFFLTDFAGIPPQIAGTISLVAITWDAITDPVVGYLTDNCKSKYGRRRPFLLGGAVPYAICMFLVFNNINASLDMKIVYFYFAAILFWTSYKFFVIPFFALGAEITNDFDDRTSLRSYASIFIYLAVLCASALPPILLEKIAGTGATPTQAWNYLGIGFAVVIFGTALICWFSTRGKELKIDWDKRKQEEEKEGKKENFFTSLFAIIKLKPTILLGISVFAWSAASIFLSSGPVYLMSNNLGYGGEQQTMYFTFMSLIAIVWIPVINIVSRKLGKKTTYWTLMVVSIIGLLVYYFIGFASFVMYLIYAAVFAIGNTGYWTLYYSMMYDISELDEFKSGKRREGSISALMSFAQKLGAAFAIWLIGNMLAAGGYDGTLETQSQEALDMIYNLNTIVPAGIAVIAVIAAIFYPITGKRYNLLVKALEAKREGKEYSTDGFEKLL